MISTASSWVDVRALLACGGIEECKFSTQLISNGTNAHLSSNWTEMGIFRYLFHCSRNAKFC